MSDARLYWRNWEEDQLAAFQGNQGSSNHCAKYAAVSALNLLYDQNLNGDELVAWVEARILKGTGAYTIFGNHNGSLVYQTANLVKKASQLAGLFPRVRCGRGQTSDLLNLLQKENVLSLITLTYLRGEEPVIAQGKNTHSALAAGGWVGGHILIPAAHDPGHHNQDGLCTPWGFLSSWGTLDQIYWMTENDLKHSWGRLSICNMVTITRSGI